MHDACEKEAFEYLQSADMDTKLAIMMYCSGMDKEKAAELLKKHDGFLRNTMKEAAQGNSE